MAFRRRETSIKAMKTLVSTSSYDGKPEGRSCNYCYIKGHLKADCRKHMAAEKRAADSKSSGGGSTSKKVSAKEIEADMADVGLLPWDEPNKVTVSKLDIDLDKDESVFDTGATHDVFNSSP